MRLFVYLQDAKYINGIVNGFSIPNLQLDVSMD